MTAFTVEVIMALEEGERPNRAWWRRRYERAVTRAGGMPAEFPAPPQVTLDQETDPDTGERFVRATVPLPPGTALGRARELSHMLTSVLAGEGYTLRADGLKLAPLPEYDDEAPEAEMGGTAHTEARVYSKRCLACAFSSETRIACCTQGAAFSLTDLGAALLAGDEEFVAKVLALPGQREDVKWHPYLSGGKCIFHDPNRGCSLPRERMPLQCRTYLCAPERLLPPELLADYRGYVDALEEAETFIEDHMHFESDIDFTSPLDAMKEAARKAFAAWAAGER